jgi:molecular chaperone DnaK (HSP70)
MVVLACGRFGFAFGAGRLTEREIKDMLDHAEEHKDQDKELRENLAARASLES